MDPSPKPGWPSFQRCAQALAPLFVAGRERRRRVVDRRQGPPGKSGREREILQQRTVPQPLQRRSARAWRAAARPGRIRGRQPGAPGGRSGIEEAVITLLERQALLLVQLAAGRAAPWRLGRRAAPRRSPGVRHRAASASVAATDVRQGGPRDRVALAPRFGAERATPEFSRLAGARRQTAPPLASRPGRDHRQREPGDVER